MEKIDALAVLLQDSIISMKDLNAYMEDVRLYGTGAIRVENGAAKHVPIADMLRETKESGELHILHG